MTGFSAVIDTDCLYPLYLRDILLDLALMDFYRPLWSKSIMEELARTRIVNLGITLEVSRQLNNDLDSVFPEASVSAFEHLIGTTGCKDSNDEHVMAAAIVGKASAIVTKNVKDFPDNSFTKFGIEIIHPDEFLLDQIDLNPMVVNVAMAKLIESYSRPEIDAAGLAEATKKAGCPKFGKYLLNNSQVINELASQLRIARRGMLN